MKCPYCDFDGARTSVHAHLEDSHADAVELIRGEGETEQYFRLGCPRCDQEAVRPVNPRGREPEFLEEFAREIRLVAFDLLLYHMQGDHPEALGLPPHALEADG